ncbi:MAG TPA: hypothetical protein DCE42_26860 [Myxococcales bacterium]|nr:hypothetical protein [Deltaproteobacteria bacterium]HAA58413.1 hypothetical protein [Myxococcales bacterium]|tara:strand:- start:1861 stop:2487 length:627 start_codon:yes stop_codon:yes gene_type:complete
MKNAPKSLRSLVALFILLLPNTQVAALTLRTSARPQKGVHLSVGVPQISLGYWNAKQFGVNTDIYLATGTELATVSAVSWTFGRFFRLAGGTKGWALESTLAAGLLLQTLSPALAIMLSPSLRVAFQNNAFRFFIGLAAPCHFRVLMPFEEQFALQLESGVSWKIGLIWLGIQGGLGAKLFVQRPFSFSPQVAISASLPLPTYTQGDK